MPTSSAAVGNCRLELTPARRDWLAQLDRRPAPLLDYLSARGSHKLGIYFERLWHFFLREDPTIDLLAVNLPVRQAGQTLGEFDALYFCQSRQRHVHLELAVKFFLGLAASPSEPGSGQWQSWLGPNSRDRLDIKLNHMLNHQIRLGEQPAASQQLLDMGIADLDRELEMKGYLFQHQSRPRYAPVAYNEQRPFSTWITHKDWSQQAGMRGSTSFLPLNRLQWLAPVRRSRHGLSTTALRQHLTLHFDRCNNALLVAQLDASGNETARTFITPDTWPQPAADSRPGNLHR